MRQLAVLLLLTIPHHAATQQAGGLEGFFESQHHDTLQFCNVTSLPTWVDWCDDQPDWQGIIPETSVCQSSVDLLPYYTCHSGQWSENWDVAKIPYIHRRLKRSGIGLAVTRLHSKACSFLCSREEPTVGHLPPHFTSCPSDVILYADDFNGTAMFHNWTEPMAADNDSLVSEVIQFDVNATASRMFDVAIAPGTKAQVTFMAVADDNMKWPCSFTVTGKIRTCPPFPHPANCNTTCSHGHLQGSNCTFDCFPGYRLNGSQSAVCQEDEQWSVAGQEPVCEEVRCDAHPDNVTSISNGMFVCGEDQGLLYSVCWAKCSDTYTLRNDDYEEEVKAELALSIAMVTGEIATAEAAIAAASLEINRTVSVSTEANEQKADALSVFLTASLAAAQAVQEATNANETFRNKTAELQKAQQALADAELNGFPNATDIAQSVDALLEDVNQTEALVQTSTTIALEALAINETAAEQWLNASLTAAQATEDVDNAVADHQRTINALATLEAQLETLNQTLINVTAQAARSDKVINAFAMCNEDGNWTIPGTPTCNDLKPPVLTCSPILIIYTDGQNNGTNVTWDLPEASDNSGLEINITQTSGPGPNQSFAIGQHFVEFAAVDVFGNESPSCTMIVSVEEIYCGSLSKDITDENMQFECHGYKRGHTCDLTCRGIYVIEGPDIVTCELDDSVTPAGASWNLQDSQCVEPDGTCPNITEPDNGVIVCNDNVIVNTTNTTNECDFNTTTDFNATDCNTTTNATDVTDPEPLTCTVVCNQGYTLPYEAVGEFVCLEQGFWQPDPGLPACVEAGGRHYTEYTVSISYYQSTCNTDHLENTEIQFTQQLEGILSTFDLCATGYVCEVNTVNAVCDGTVTNVRFSVLLTCDDLADTALSEPCDLEQDRMSVLLNDITKSVTDGDLPTPTDATLTENWLLGEVVDIPECNPGSILVGAFCERCQKGYFLDIDADQCVPCPMGYYGDESGLSVCKLCPASTSTTKTGATSVNECADECSAGSYSSTSVEPCLQCEMGYYQTEPGSRSCDKCSSGTSSTILGSSNRSDCVRYDLYFERAVTNPLLMTTMFTLGKATLAFWLWGMKSPSITVGFYNDDDLADSTFVLDTSDGTTQLLFDGLDNQPIQDELEPSQWLMIVLTWDGNKNEAIYYKNGEPIETISTRSLDRSDMQSVYLSAAAGTVISGLSISTEVASPASVESLTQACSMVPFGVIYTMHALNAEDIRRAGIKPIPTFCTADVGEEEGVDFCQSHVCQHNATCQAGDTGYTCNCTATYTGPFCEIPIVDADWSEWYNQTGCSVTCGQGTQQRYRVCNDPFPGRDGAACPGNDTEVVQCDLEACPVCPNITDASGTVCVLDANDECSPLCPSGKVLPRGQHDQRFKCGKTTAYQWAPLDRLPICATSVQPQSYSLQLGFTVTPVVPCNVVPTIENGVKAVLAGTECPVNIQQCTYNAIIGNCLPVTDSILEAVTAVIGLETTANVLIGDPQQMNVLHDGVLYVINGGDVLAAVSCPQSYLPIEGVCATCQAGTRELSGWCVYCDVGYYQSQEGQSSCVTCPVGMTTISIGSRNQDECTVDPTYITPQTPVVTVPAIPTEEGGLSLGLLAGIAGGGVFLIILIIIITIIACRKYKEKKKRELQGSQLIKFPGEADKSYNMYYKRRHVMGFDKGGHPVVHSDALLRDFELEPFPDENGQPTKGQGLVVYPPVNQGPFAEKDKSLPLLSLGTAPFDACDVEALKYDNFDYPEEYEQRLEYPNIRGIDRFRVPGRPRLLQAPIASYNDGKILLSEPPIIDRPGEYISPRVPLPASIPPIQFQDPTKLASSRKSSLAQLEEERHEASSEETDSGISRDREEDRLILPKRKPTLVFEAPFPRLASGHRPQTRAESPAPFKRTARAKALLRQLTDSNPSPTHPTLNKTRKRTRRELKVYGGKTEETLIESAPYFTVPMVFNPEEAETRPQSYPRPWPGTPSSGKLYERENSSPEMHTSPRTKVMTTFKTTPPKSVMHHDASLFGSHERPDSPEGAPITRTSSPKPSESRPQSYPRPLPPPPRPQIKTIDREQSPQDFSHPAPNTEGMFSFKQFTPKPDRRAERPPESAERPQSFPRPLPPTPLPAKTSVTRPSSPESPHPAPKPTAGKPVEPPQEEHRVNQESEETAPTMWPTSNSKSVHDQTKQLQISKQDTSVSKTSGEISTSVSPREVQMSGMSSTSQSNASIAMVSTPRDKSGAEPKQTGQPNVSDSVKSNQNTKPKHTKQPLSNGDPHEVFLTAWTAQRAPLDIDKDSDTSSILTSPRKPENEHKLKLSQEDAIVETGIPSPVWNTLPTSPKERPGSAGSIVFVGLQNNIPPEDFRDHPEPLKSGKNGLPVIRSP